MKLARRDASLLILCLLAGCVQPPRVFDADAQSIRLARAVPGVKQVESKARAFNWEVVGYCTARHRCPEVDGSEPSQTFPIRIVCYCNPEHVTTGWYVEVHLDTNRADGINGNRTLEATYTIYGRAKRSSRSAEGLKCNTFYLKRSASNPEEKTFMFGPGCKPIDSA
jgi:hypothetical protein